MAINFQLYKLGDPKEESLTFNKVDEEICQMLGVEPHHRFYGGNCENGFDWYNSVGFALASGQSYSNLMKSASESGSMIERKVILFMNENYGVRSWRSWGKR